MVDLGYNYTSNNHIKSSGLLAQHRYPLSTYVRGVDTMTNHTPTVHKRKHEVISGVYMITCLAGGERYIGSSYDIYKRLGEHIGHLVRNDHGNHYLQAAWNCYGEFAFKIEILEECPRNQRNKRERELILEMSPEWNLKLPNEQLDGWTVSEETRARISAAGRGRVFSEEHRRRKSEAQVGRSLTEETRKRISASHKKFHRLAREKYQGRLF